MDEEIDETIRSKNSKYTVTMYVENETNKDVMLYWYDYEGTP